jgi:glycosyltransferase involved in cell wall biosynthesis
MRKIEHDDVTVAICVRNGEKYIEEAIISAEGQSVAPFQILVIDDGSQDLSASIAEKKGCTVIRQNPIGLGGARNKALKNAVTPWVFFLDADDLMTENALFYLLTAARANRSVVGVSGLRRNFISPELQNTLRLVDGRSLDAERSHLPSGSLWKSETRLLPPFDESLEIADMEWMMRLRTGNYALAQTEETVLLRRIHLDNHSYTQDYKNACLNLAIGKIRQGQQSSG